jgi:hypothetical protein
MKIFKYSFAFLIFVACESKDEISYALKKTAELELIVPIEFSTPMTNTYPIGQSLLLTNLSNKILVLDRDKYLIDSLINFPDFLINDIGTITYNTFSKSIIAHSESRNGFVEKKNGKFSFYPLNSDQYSILENRKSSGNFISDYEMVFPLIKGDLSLFPAEMISNDLTTFAIYDFKLKKVVANFGVYPDELLSNKGMYPKEFQIPHYILNNGKLIIGYPLSNEVMVIDIKEKNKIEKFLIKSDDFVLPKPFVDREDRSEVFKLFYYSNQYGRISYHSELSIFSRIVLHELQVNSSDACSRLYSLILFDKEFKVLDEISLDEVFKADWNFALPNEKGFLVSGMCENYLGEDYFIYNANVEIVGK